MKAARIYSVPMTINRAFGWRWRAEDYSQESTDCFVFRKDCIADAKRNGYIVLTPGSTQEAVPAAVTTKVLE